MQNNCDLDMKRAEICEYYAFGESYAHFSCVELWIMWITLTGYPHYKSLFNDVFIKSVDNVDKFTA